MSAGKGCVTACGLPPAAREMRCREFPQMSFIRRMDRRHRAQVERGDAQIQRGHGAAQAHCRRRYAIVGKVSGQTIFEFPDQRAEVGCRYALATLEVFIEFNTRQGAPKLGHAEQRVAVCLRGVRLEFKRPSVAGVGIGQATQI